MPIISGGTVPPSGVASDLGIVIGPQPSGDTTGAIDTAALQAAIETATGKELWLPGGTYYLNASLTLDVAGVSLRGAGMYQTTLTRAAAYGNVVGVSSDNVTVSDLAIDGGLASFAGSANHGISAQNVNHFLALRVKVTNYQNSAILCQGTPSQTYRDNIIEACLCDGTGGANNGFLIVNLDESGMRHCVARNCNGGGGPGYGCQLKNGCRWCFIEDCEAYTCTGGLCFGRDSSPGVAQSRITGGVVQACDGGILCGDATDNTITGVTINMSTNVNDAIRFLNTSVGNVATGIVVRGVGASRSCVRCDDTSTDNTVTLDSVNCSGAAATFTCANTADRNLVYVKKYVNTPAHEFSNTSTGTLNRLRRVDDRRTLYDTALGVVIQTFDRALPTAALAMTSQQPYYIPVYLQPGEVITNVTFHVSTLSVAPTNFYVGLYNSALTRLAVSNDLAASVTTTGQKTLAFTGSYVVLDSGVYYVGLLNNGGTLSPLGLAASTAGRIGSNPFTYAQDTSTTSTTLPAPGTIAAGTKAFWVEVS